MLLLVVLLPLLAACGADRTEVAEPDHDEEIDRLRALPYLDFSPEKAEGGSGVVDWDPERAFLGYSLYSVRNYCSAELIDMDGDVLRSWTIEPCDKWSNAELQPNGDLLVVGVDPIEVDTRAGHLGARYVARLDWDGNEVWKARLPAHHDVQPVPESDRLITLDWNYRRIPAINTEIDVRDNRLALLSKEGEVLESKSLYDLMSVGAPYNFRSVLAGEKGGEPELDIFHANSVEWFGYDDLIGSHPAYGPNNVLVSIRHQNAIAVIDWQREELVWSWGQDELAGPHDATFLPNGNIMVYDNGLGRGWSRILEVDPRTDEIVWRYQAPKKRRRFYSVARGSNQRLPNGNTLIAESDRGRAFEVTPEGETVWSWKIPHVNDQGHRATIVRIERYVRDENGHFVVPELP